MHREWEWEGTAWVKAWVESGTVWEHEIKFGNVPEEKKSLEKVMKSKENTLQGQWSEERRRESYCLKKKVAGIIIREARFNWQQVKTIVIEGLKELADNWPWVYRDIKGRLAETGRGRFGLDLNTCGKGFLWWLMWTGKAGWDVSCRQFPPD